MSSVLVTTATRRHRMPSGTAASRPRRYGATVTSRPRAEPRSPATWPDFDVERSAVRVILTDPTERILLLRVQDHPRPDLHPWWELPGGGIEPGESITDAATRELAEETGILLDAGVVSDALWRRDCTYQHRGRRILQHEQIVLARLDRTLAHLPPARRTATELDDILGHHWWTTAELRSSTERFFPGRLPDFIDALLAGQQVQDQFEVWD